MNPDFMKNKDGVICDMKAVIELSYKINGAVWAFEYDTNVNALHLVGDFQTIPQKVLDALNNDIKKIKEFF